VLKIPQVGKGRLREIKEALVGLHPELKLRSNDQTSKKRKGAVNR